jgi:hypothetical protein
MLARIRYVSVGFGRAVKRVERFTTKLQGYCLPRAARMASSGLTR